MNLLYSMHGCYYYYLCVCVEFQDVFSTAQRQMGHFSLAVRLITVANEAYNSCVFCKFNLLYEREVYTLYTNKCIGQARVHSLVESLC